MPQKRPYILATSVCGALHKAKGLPCQDYYCSKSLGRKTVAVVSDGAGSAKFGKLGAKVICETICNTLLRSNIGNVQKDVENAIRTAREKLIFHRYNKSKSEAELVNFSATIVGFFCHNGRGVFFHIGDGAALAFASGKFDNFTISEPENGAYSCETYFYTMTEWQECLRFTPFENANRVILMTDGVTGFVFSDDFYKIRQNFLIPIIQYLEKEKNKKHALSALHNTLNDTKAQRINPDDKTILWVELP